MDRRGFIFGSAAATVTLKASFAQDATYPTHAIVMINPFPPGGAADVVGRPLALFGAQRSKALPDVPTMKELGYDVEYYLWVGLFAPKGTPADVITYLREVVGKAAHSDTFKVALANLGQELAYMDQAQFTAFWEADSKRIEAAIRSIGKVEG